MFVLMLAFVCVRRVCQAILIEVPRLHQIIVVENTPTSWPGYPRGISVHNMAAVQKLGARPENGKFVYVFYRFLYNLITELSLILFLYFGLCSSKDLWNYYYIMVLF